MNFIDRFLLRVVMLPTFLYDKLGVDTPQLRAILTAKLTMDNRRPASFGMQKRRSDKKEINGATLKMILSGLIMGLFMLFSFAVGNGMVTKLALFMTMFIFMVCLTLITDFTSVLIDIRDNLILLPKPVSDVTFMTGRLLHIAIRTSIIVFPLSVPACVTAAIIQGPAIILPFILMIVQMTLLSIFFINAVYLLILKITTPAKFQNIIGSIQIVFVMIVMLAYQVLPRMVDSSVMQHISISEIPFVRFVPSFWFADACMLLSGGGFTMEAMISLMLSVVVPVLSIWVVIRFFAPSFNQKLGMITGGTVEQTVATTKAGAEKQVVKQSFWQRIAHWFTKPGAERAGFLFASHMITRSRDFKMKVYPSFGSILIICIMPFLQNHTLTDVSLASPKIFSFLLLLMYMCSLPLSAALMQVSYSDKFKASWIFFVTPLERPGAIISGTVKCMMVFFLIPFALILTLVGVAFQGYTVLPNMLLGCINLLVICSLLAYLSVKKLPFSTAQETSTRGNTFVRTMLFLVIPVTIGIVHWLLSGFLWAILLWIVISSVALWLIFDEIKKREWQSLNL